MKIPRHFALAAALLLTAMPAAADIIGVEQFDYPDGAIAGSSGGTFWDYKNTSPVGHGGVASTWDNLASAPQVTAGRLVTSGNGAVKREYRGANETEGAVNDANVAKQVFFRVTVTTGPSVSAADYFGISSMDFGTEEIYFGKRGGSATWGVEEVGVGGTNGSVTILPNTTYTLVAIVNFTNDFIRLYVDPNLNGAEPGPGSAAASRAYTGTNWSTAVRFAAGTAVTWDDLVVATTWEDLGTIVTTTADQDDGGLNPSGGISLREAVKYSPAGTLVTFAPALSGQTCTLTGSQLTLPAAGVLTIDASALSGGFTISGNDTHRHFHVEAGKALTLRGLTLTRGNGTGSGGFEGGSIVNDGTLNLQRCDFTGNATSFSGGAVSSIGTLRATDTTMAENTAMGFGGGLMVTGGTAELSRCTLSGNTANDAGAFWQQGTATATLSHCTVAGNRSTGSTTTGGIVALGGTLTLQHCTVSQNVGNGNGGLYLQAPASVNVANSIIAGNAAPGGTRPDVYFFNGTLTPNGTNLIGDNTGVETVFPAGTPNGGTTDDYVGNAAAPLDPKLSALGHFGGPVMTLHPLTGSWAIDKAGGTPPAAPTDARGFSRFEDGDASESPQLDIGAVEAGAVTFVTTNVDEDNGAGGAGVSLREALALSTTPGRRIRFHPGVFPGTITLGGTELTLPATPGLFIDASNITGEGVTISGDNASRVFSVPVSATAGLHSLKIVAGDLAAGGSGIANQGTLSLMACVLSGNSSGFGGAIYNEGPLLVWRSTFSGNTTNNDGGAILNDAGGRLTVVQSSFSGNAANVGGAILNQGRAALTQTTLSGNTANTGGGGFFSLGSGSMVLSQSIVAGNTSPAGGQDIHVDGGSVTPSGTNFVGNLANSGLTASATLLTGNALLAPLASNGGPTQTMALRSGSPARNAAGPVNEVQRIPAAGPVVNHRLTFKGQTTALIGTEDSAATFQSALAALSTIGAGNVSVSGSGSTRQIDFIGSLAAADQPQLTSDSPFLNSGITTLTQGHPGSSLTTDQRGLARFGLPDLGAFESQISSLADVTIKANTATGALPFTVGQVGTLTATSGNPTLLPDAGIVLGGSGANRTITLTPAAHQSGTAVVTLSASTGETLTFTLTVTAFEVTTLADTASPGSLRQALADAAASPGADLILFAPALSGKTITLASEILITDPAGVTIDGSDRPTGIVIDGGTDTNRHFRIEAGTAAVFQRLRLYGGGGTGGGTPANYGGSIHNNGNLTLRECTFADNSSTNAAGAVYNQSGALTVERSTFHGNTSGSSGAILHESLTPLTITASTFTGNIGRFEGGAITLGGFRPATLTHCTITGNAVTQTGGGGSGGIRAGNPANAASNLLTLRDSIVAENTDANTPGVPNVNPGFTNPAGSSNLVNLPANLAALGDYGGPAWTMPPMPGSQALDAATGSSATTDQRGVFRPLNGDNAGLAVSDLGAVEVPIPLTVTTRFDENDTPAGSTLSLREAIRDAEPGATILFNTSFDGEPSDTITLSQSLGQIVFPRGLIVNASGNPGGVTVDGGPGTNRIFQLPPGTGAFLQRLTLTGGNGVGGGQFGDSGGAIDCFSATLALTDCVLTGNTSPVYGGAISSASTQLTLDRCLLTGNTASNFGGAISSGSADLAGPVTFTTTLTNCTLTNNTSAVRGGAIDHDNDRATLLHCTITGNTAPAGAGSGVLSLGNNLARTTVQNCLIAGNANSSDVSFFTNATNTFLSLGGNIIGTGNATGTFNQLRDLTGQTAATLRLAPLADYGGPTPTMALRPGSPALGNATLSPVTTDQRGFPAVGSKDSGAYEAGTITNYANFIWESLPHTAAEPQAAATFDFDGDGESNGDEYTAGTLASDPLSVFRIVQTSLGGGIFSVTFPTVTGRTYQLQSSPDLADPWTDVGSAAGGTGGNVTLPANVAGFSRYFFRVSVAP